MKKETYRNGDRIEYTGKSQMLHGAMAWEFVYVDGLKKGQTGVTYNKPTTTPDDETTEEPDMDAIKTREINVLVRENRVLLAENAELKKALNLHLAFLKSLPDGWLLHTSGDVGLLNDAFLASRKALNVPYVGKAKISTPNEQETK